MILYRNVFHLIGIMLLVFSCVVLLPCFVDLAEGNETSSCFVISSLMCGFFGGLLFLSTKDHNTVSLNVREKAMFVLLIWLLLPFFSVLPFLFSAYSISFVNALFESTAAITTSGATIIDLRNLSDGFLLWLSLLQFWGGLLFVFTCVYIFPAFKQTDRYMYDGSQSYSLQKIARNIGIFAAIKTMVAFIASFLLAGSGLTAINSLCCSFATISSGGIIPLDIGIVEASGKITWILAALMFFSGISIGFINNIIVNGVSELKSRQFLSYLIFVFVFSSVFALRFFYNTDLDILKSFEKSFFATVSSITTTGLQYNNDEWVNNMLYILNFCGGCSGSSTGGIKIFRIITILLILKTYFIKLVKANAVYVPNFDGRRISEFDITNLLSYFICLIVLAILFSAMLSFSGMSFGEAFGGVITTMNNNGPFWGASKATVLQLSTLSVSSKSVLIAAMISGRLEFVLFFVVISRIFWKR